jgi:3',5'-cyclic AMP phosphodiesterase CpdA
MSLRRLLVLVLVCVFFSAVAAATPLRIGVVTDIHAHDTNSPNQYTVMVNYESRLAAFVDAMTAWPADAVFELGDLVNGIFVMGAPLGDPARIPGILSSAVETFGRFAGPKYFVLGNHDVYDLSKDEFLAGVGASTTTWSFDLGGYHLVALDAQFTRAGADVSHISWMIQGTIPAPELEWLRQDLASSVLPTVVFIHQPLDETNDMGGPSISNRLDVQAILSQSGHVIAVFQGHMHGGKHTVLDGIHYVTFTAMVDRDEPTPPSWAAVTLDPEARTVRIDGEGLQDDIEFAY